MQTDTDTTATVDTSTATVKTYRGRSLDELLPQIRTELGPDAVVLRRREGLAGGVAGFFQKAFIEVEARGPLAEERAADAASARTGRLDVRTGDSLDEDVDVEMVTRNDRATSDGMRSPTVQTLIEQASPFADELRRAQRPDASEGVPTADVLAGTDSRSAGLYGPQPNAAGARAAALAAQATEPVVVEPADAAHLHVGDESAAADALLRAHAARALAEARRAAQEEAPIAMPAAPEEEEAELLEPAHVAEPKEEAAGIVGHATDEQDVAAPDHGPASDQGAAGAVRGDGPSDREEDRSDQDDAPTHGAASAPTAALPASPIGTVRLRGEGDGPLTRGALVPVRQDPATVLERRLSLGGLDSGLAADVVGEAVDHGVPFGGAGSLRRLTLLTLSRRISVMRRVGPGPRALAFVGTAGSGKSQATALLAEAYAAAERMPVVVIALRSKDRGAALRSRFEGSSVAVHAPTSAGSARKIIDASPTAMVIVDTPAVGLRDAEAVRVLGEEVRSLGLDEVHVALPATTSAAATAEMIAALNPIGLSHVALTRMDETDHPGGPIGFCMGSGCPVSYMSEGDRLEPADPVSLAMRLM